MRTVAVTLAALDWEQVDDSLRKKVVHGERMTVTRYSFDAGGRFPHHVHDQEQVTFVLAGALTFVVDGEEHPLGEGDVVVIPADVPHSAHAGSDGAEVLSVVSPARMGGRGVDYLEEG